MTKFIFALTFIFLFTPIIEAEENEWVKTDTTEANYMVNGEVVRQLIFSVDNISDENIWLVFENDKSKSDYELIKERYLRKQDDGITLFNMIIDPNAIFGNWIFDIYNCFLKIIKPHKSFNVIVTYCNRIEAYNFIDKIRLIPMHELEKTGRFLMKIEPNNVTTYQPECMSINISSVSDRTKNN